MRSFAFAGALLLAFVATCYAGFDGSSLEARSSVAPNDMGIRNSCGRIRALTLLNNFAHNRTALDAMLANGAYDQRQIDYIKIQATDITSELTSLTSNATLTGQCNILDARRKVAGQCNHMKRLQRLAKLVNNQTAWDEHLAKEILNKKQLEDLRKNIANAKGRLKELKGNSTLVGLCKNRTEQLLKDDSNGNGTWLTFSDDLEFIVLTRQQQW